MSSANDSDGSAIQTKWPNDSCREIVDETRIIKEDGMFSGARWTAARHVVAGLLVGLGLARALGTGRLPTARAALPMPMENSGTMALTAGEPGAAQWLYLIDTRAQSFVVYRIDPRNANGAVKLEAARKYSWDLRLAEYNNAAPDVQTISSMVGDSKR